MRARTSWLVAAVAGRASLAVRQLAVQLVVELRRADLDERRLATAGVEALGQAEDPGPLAALA
jgi:hypothetical protein